MKVIQVSKTVYWKIYKVFVLFMILILTLGNFGSLTQNRVSAQAVAQPSHNIAIIDSVTVRNGGSFPTTTTGPTGSFLDFNFYILPRANLSLTELEPGGVCGIDGCDTVLLNVASTGIACNINNLTLQQKDDLIYFVNLGRKLIIYDSECVTQDYSWLPYPFTTVNPGALGAQGTLTIVEDNTLSSNDPTSPNFIDSFMLGAQTDAVGDMNVMTTYDPNWFLDMSGTNAIKYTGPVHTYASLPPGTDAGLIIYNGLDVDAMTTSTIPSTGTPAGNLAKIWLQELQQVFNPSDLPGTNPVIGIILTPETATLNVGEDHTVTAVISDLLGDPQSGIQVTFEIETGPNEGVSGICSPNSDCTTDQNGQVSFTYTGSGGIGTDQIVGIFERMINNVIQQYRSDQVSAEWIVTHYVFTAPFPTGSIKSWSDPLEKNVRRTAMFGISDIVESQQDLNTGQLGYNIFAWGGMLGFFNWLAPTNAQTPTEEAYIQSLMGVDFLAPITGEYTIKAEIELSGECYGAAGPGALDFLALFIPGELGKILDFLSVTRITDPSNLLPKAAHSDNALILKVGTSENRDEEGFGDMSVDTILLPEFEFTLSGIKYIETVVQLNAGDIVYIEAGLESDIDAWGNASVGAKTLDSKLISITITPQ